MAQRQGLGGHDVAPVPLERSKFGVTTREGQHLGLDAQGFARTCGIEGRSTWDALRVIAHDFVPGHRGDDPHRLR